MTYEDTNMTELRALARARGFSVLYYTSRDELIRMLEDAAPPSGSQTLTLIDLHRTAMIDWAMKNWSKVYNQISCPLDEAGCFGCTEFRTVSCLVRNNHVFDVGKEMHMAAWSEIISHLVNKDTERAIAILEGLAKTQLGNDRPTRSALTKVVHATLDLIQSGDMKNITAYLETRPNDAPQDVIAIMKDKTAQDVLTDIIQKLKEHASNQRPKGPAESKPQISDSTDFGDPDDGNAADEAYFPGIEVTGPPLTTGQDAYGFAKTSSKSKAAPNKTPSTAPSTQTTRSTTSTPPAAAQAAIAPNPISKTAQHDDSSNLFAEAAMLSEAIMGIANSLAKLANAIRMEPRDVEKRDHKPAKVRADSAPPRPNNNEDDRKGESEDGLFMDDDDFPF